MPTKKANLSRLAWPRSTITSLKLVELLYKIENDRGIISRRLIAEVVVVIELCLYKLYYIKYI